MRYEELTIEGRNAVLEAFRSGKTIDKLFVQDGCKDGPILSITREARKHDTLIKYVPRERLDQLSETGKHQGVIAYAAAYEYAEVEDILKNASPACVFAPAGSTKVFGNDLVPEIRSSLYPEEIASVGESSLQCFDCRDAESSVCLQTHKYPSDKNLSSG